MQKKDIKIKVNKKLWKQMKEKVKKDFNRSYCDTDCLLIIISLALYKKKHSLRCEDSLYLLVDNLTDLAEENYIFKTISIYGKLMENLKDVYKKFSYSQIVERAIVDYLHLPINFYTDCISPLYTIVGSKNYTMQKATAKAVDNMSLSHKDMVLIDACCATGSLFLGLETYEWKKIILNDMSALRTNFLNVLKSEPLKLIKMLLETDFAFIEQSETKNKELHNFKDNTDEYEQKRINYKKVDCNIQIAYQMFLRQCIDKAQIEGSDKIFSRILKFLPAHLKLQSAIITKTDCLTYLKNDTPKLVLLDVPYIGSEKECAVKGYCYEPFHGKVANLLQQAGYPFIYYCRSSAPKSDTIKSTEDKLKIMKMKLGGYFMDKNFYFQKIHLKEDTELLISNQEYDAETQFQWTDFEQDLL